MNQAHDKGNGQIHPETPLHGTRQSPRSMGRRISDYPEALLHDTRPTSPVGTSLRTKGVGLLALLLVYTLAAGFVMNMERNNLYSDVRQLEAVHADEERQFNLNMLVTRAILVVNDNYYSANLEEPTARSITMQIEAVLNGLGKMVQSYPVLRDDVSTLQANLADMGKPLNRAIIAGVRGTLHKLVMDLSQVTSDIRSRKQTLLVQYRATFDRMFVIWAFTAAIGIVVLGGLVMIFVTRLAWDIRRVQDRAMAVIEGYGGKPLAVTRFDELGALMEAVNTMQLELRRHEMQLELIRQQRFHKEKMAAIGSLAAVVAHEINNPLSAIAGAAQAMIDQRAMYGSLDRRATRHPDMILEQARRVMDITRRISQFSTPQSTEPELLDLNSLIRNTVDFVSFDRRFGTVKMLLDLDPQLPAIYAVGDHLTQVIINLLVNAADATEGRLDPKPGIVVATRRQEGFAVITVTDGGMGMDKDTLAHAFEEYFTTKPPGKGSGIGLAVSKSLIEAGGGAITIESEPGTGTTVTLRFPVRAEECKEET